MKIRKYDDLLVNYNKLMKLPIYSQGELITFLKNLKLSVKNDLIFTAQPSTFDDFRFS